MGGGGHSQGKGCIGRLERHRLNRLRGFEAWEQTGEMWAGVPLKPTPQGGELWLGSGGKEIQHREVKKPRGAL